MIASGRLGKSFNERREGKFHAVLYLADYPEYARTYGEIVLEVDFKEVKSKDYRRSKYGEFCIDEYVSLDRVRIRNIDLICDDCNFDHAELVYLDKFVCYKCYHET